MRRLLIVLSLLTLSSCAPKAEKAQNKLLHSFIMNGTDVKEGDPIASSIVGVFNTKDKSICTGSLIGPNIVLTAAHCVPERASHVKIVFSNNIDYTMNAREPDVLQEFALSATDFKVGPTWDPNDETTEVDTGDIALIKFKGTIPVGYKAAKFLPDNSALKAGAMVTVAGYGINVVNATQIDPRKYHKLEEAIEYGEVYCEENDNKKMTCYKVETDGDGVLRTTQAPIASIDDTEVRLDERKAGTCNGDSGGPAYILQNGELFLFGVTSRGSALCNEVGVYTNALYYSTWINETIKKLK